MEMVLSALNEMKTHSDGRRIVDLDTGDDWCNERHNGIVSAKGTLSHAFDCLVDDELAHLRKNLTQGFQEMITEREMHLRPESERVGEISLHTHRAHVGTPGLSKTVSSSSIGALRAYVPATLPCPHPSPQKPTKIGMNGSKPVFEVLPELLKEVWTGDELLEHTGSSSTLDSSVANTKIPLPKNKIPKCVLDPSSLKRLLWDFIGIPVLAWDLITMPLQTFDLGQSGEKFLEECGALTMCYWSVDLPLSFITGFLDAEGRLVTDRRRIIKKYLCGNFLLDFIIVVSDWADQITTWIGEGDNGYVSNLAMMRFLRIARFIRVFRLRKLKSKAHVVQDILGNELALVVWSLFAKVCCLILINHFIGCGWYLIGAASNLAEPGFRWVTSVPYPQYDHNGHKMVEADWFYLYCTSFHWAIAQFTPGPQNIQPQNSYERLYCIFVLLFGMVVFSYFIASVTSLRLQMSKMLSKLDRDLWLLRKFCYQHGVSLELRARMTRYIELVVIPNYHRLHLPDVLLIPKLSDHLRAELFNELYSAPLRKHPLFERLQAGYRSVMDEICSTCLVSLSLARGDIAFEGGQVARFMFLCDDGEMSYTPVAKQLDAIMLHPGDWVSEAVLWTNWTHQGLMQVTTESHTILVDAAQMRAVFEKNGFVLRLIRGYATRFCDAMNEHVQKNGMPTDIQTAFSQEIRMCRVSKMRQVYDFFKDDGNERTTQ